MYEIGVGIQYLHNQSVVHRDLKPENILIKNGKVKIADFGLAKTILLNTRTLLGTLYYVAPELFRMEAYGKSVDIFAIGVIFIELLLNMRIWSLIGSEEFPGRMNSFPTTEIKNRLK